MSRQAHLPPRCPFQKKVAPRSTHEPIPPTPRRGYDLRPQHHKSSSQSSILEEQPAWLDDLLDDSDLNSKGTSHRRSASDSLTLLDGIVDQFPSLTPLNEERSVCNESCSKLESDCMYGPNSPRRRGSLTFSENAIVSALSEYVSQNTMQYIDKSHSISGIACSDLRGDGCRPAGELNAETKTVKRHPGQRSRVRKLQYIAELERTVNVLQGLESELVARVASLRQQHVALSMENGKLKHRVGRLQQEKLLIDGEYHSLRKEVERLKIGLANSSSREGRSYFRSSSAAETVGSDATWQMLDIGAFRISTNAFGASGKVPQSRCVCV
ncbi:basic leucine zipper 2 isoform X2 [Malania oleifera]|uniref:basic leucine zipper 2 isoform X2 n=1 Tax=Malania oleifera TaxID=397392 RepID=UPI0025AE1BF0|nr:basic leucine zipper 2 isoform X2 [Malania oleifera]XP_057978902.1 basic leucine zipper 2 isoform X2 [Malania oleifera]